MFYHNSFLIRTKMHTNFFLSVSCVIKWKIMLPLYNDQISLLTVLAVYTCLLYNGHLSITTTETSSPKWSLYTSLTVHQFFTIFKFQFSEAKNFVRSLQKVVNQSKCLPHTKKLSKSKFILLHSSIFQASKKKHNDIWEEESRE